MRICRVLAVRVFQTATIFIFQLKLASETPSAPKTERYRRVVYSFKILRVKDNTVASHGPPMGCLRLHPQYSCWKGIHVQKCLRRHWRLSALWYDNLIWIPRYWCSINPVGNALKNNPFSPYIPCHRVVASDFYIGGFRGEWGTDKQPKAKLDMLEKEGVKFTKSRHLANADQSLWRV